jgi:hypothetical protein
MTCFVREARREQAQRDVSNWARPSVEPFFFGYTERIMPPSMRIMPPVT